MFSSLHWAVKSSDTHINSTEWSSEKIIFHKCLLFKCIFVSFNVKSCIWSYTTLLIVDLLTEVEKQFVWGTVWECVYNELVYWFGKPKLEATIKGSMLIINLHYIVWWSLLVNVLVFKIYQGHLRRSKEQRPVFFS